MSIAWPTGMHGHRDTHRSSRLEDSRPLCWAALVPTVREELRCRECDEFTAKRSMCLGRSEGRKVVGYIARNIQDMLIDASTACTSIDVSGGRELDVFEEKQWLFVGRGLGSASCVDWRIGPIVVSRCPATTLVGPSEWAICAPSKPPSFPSSTLSIFLAPDCPVLLNHDSFPLRKSDIRYSLLPLLGNEKNLRHNADSLLTLSHPIRHISRIQPLTDCQG